MEFPISLGFISENLRYKPPENTRHVLERQFDRAAGMVLFLKIPSKIIWESQQSSGENVKASGIWVL